MVDPMYAQVHPADLELRSECMMHCNAIVERTPGITQTAASIKIHDEAVGSVVSLEEKNIAMPHTTKAMYAPSQSYRTSFRSVYYNPEKSSRS